MSVKSLPENELRCLTVIKNRIHQRYDAEGIEYKSTEDEDTAILNYLSLLERLIVPAPRKVKYSNTLQKLMSTSLSDDENRTLKLFEKKFI